MLIIEPGQGLRHMSHGATWLAKIETTGLIPRLSCSAFSRSVGQRGCNRRP